MYECRFPNACQINEIIDLEVDVKQGATNISKVGYYMIDLYTL